MTEDEQLINDGTDKILDAVREVAEDVPPQSILLAAINMLAAYYQQHDPEKLAAFLSTYTDTDNA